MRGAPDLFLCECGKEAFHQVDPGGAGGREVEMETWPFGEPVADQSGFVRAVVIQNEMHLETGWDGGLNRIEKLAELHATMPAMEFADHVAGFNI